MYFFRQSQAVLQSILSRQATPVMMYPKFLCDVIVESAGILRNRIDNLIIDYVKIRLFYGIDPEFFNVLNPNVNCANLQVCSYHQY